VGVRAVLEALERKLLLAIEPPFRVLVVALNLKVSRFPSLVKSREIKDYLQS